MFTENYWSDALNRRKFFIEFATQKGFDPLVPENWRNITRKELAKKGPLGYYQGNIHRALADVFPDSGMHFFRFFPFTLLQLFFHRASSKKKRLK